MHIRNVVYSIISMYIIGISMCFLYILLCALYKEHKFNVVNKKAP